MGWCEERRKVDDISLMGFVFVDKKYGIQVGGESVVKGQVFLVGVQRE